MDTKRLPALCPKLFTNFWLIPNLEHQWSTGSNKYFTVNNVRNFKRTIQEFNVLHQGAYYKTIMNIDLETKLKNVFLSEMFTILKINLKLQITNLHEVSALEMVNTAQWLFCMQTVL